MAKYTDNIITTTKITALLKADIKRPKGLHFAATPEHIYVVPGSGAWALRLSSEGSGLMAYMQHVAPATMTQPPEPGHANVITLVTGPYGIERRPGAPDIANTVDRIISGADQDTVRTAFCVDAPGGKGQCRIYQDRDGRPIPIDTRYDAAVNTGVLQRITSGRIGAVVASDKHGSSVVVMPILHRRLTDLVNKLAGL